MSLLASWLLTCRLVQPCRVSRPYTHQAAILMPVLLRPPSLPQRRRAAPTRCHPPCQQDLAGCAHAVSRLGHNPRLHAGSRRHAADGCPPVPGRLPTRLMSEASSSPSVARRLRPGSATLRCYVAQFAAGWHRPPGWATRSRLATLHIKTPLYFVPPTQPASLPALLPLLYLSSHPH